MGKHEFQIYASTKTTAQLVLDVSTAVSHGFTIYALHQIGAENRTTLWNVLLYLVLVTISIQLILGIGLFLLRMMGLNEHNGTGYVPRSAKWLNNIAFWVCILVALLEIGIAGIEKLWLEGERAHANCPAQALISEEASLTH